MDLKKIKRDITAVILCGGQGQRLRPITKDLPKPLIIIKNNPILYYIIEHLKKYGVSTYVIATGYKSDKIKEYMSREFNDLDYKIVDSGDTDILTRVKKCLEGIDGDIILNYGDTISDIDIDKFISFHSTHEKNITISSYPISIPFGVMTVDIDDNVRKFEEKPVLNEVMNIGYYYIPSSFGEYINTHDNLLSLIDSLIKDNLLKCYQHQGIHITINTIAELNNAEENIEKIF
jgi:glucose-1-phosphate cytidylyltransferase